VALVHREMTGSTSNYRIPAKDELIPQYLLFLQRSDTERYVTADYQKANIIIRHRIHSSYDFKRALDVLRKKTEEILGEDLKFFITGEEALISLSADSMSGGQILSLSVMIFFIFSVMSILFVNYKAGLLSIVPNTLPILFLFGVMGWFGVPLNTGTALIAAIAIGIAVDDTIHFMVRYNQEMKNQINRCLYQ